MRYSCPCFSSVSNEWITSVLLTPPNVATTVGSSITLVCIAELGVPVPGAVVEFDYGFTNNSKAAFDGTTQFDIVTISHVGVPSATNHYTCTVTVMASGMCGGGELEPTCPTKTSNVVIPTIQCEW